MSKTLFLCVLMVLSVGAAMGFAQQEKGDSEIIFNGNYQKTFGDFGFGTMQVTGIYGYFFTAKSEILAGLVGTVTFTPGVSIGSTSVGGGTDANLGGLFGYRYNLEPREKLVPYFGGSLYIFDFSPGEFLGIGDVTFVEGGGGAKYYFNRNLAFDVNASFGFGLSDFGSNVLAVRFGLAYIFSRRG